MIAGESNYEVEYAILGRLEKMTVAGEDLLSAVKRAQVKIAFNHPREKFEIVGIARSVKPAFDLAAAEVFRRWDALDALRIIAEALHEYSPPPIINEYGRAQRNLDGS